MAEPKAHADDILVVGKYNDGQDYPQFERHQVYSARSAAAIQSRKFRKAWYTEEALVVPNKQFWLRLRRGAKLNGSEVLPLKKWRPDEDANASEVR